MFCVVKFKSVRYVLIVLLAVVLLAISFNGVSSAQVFFGYSTKKVPVYSVDTQEKQVAISFDAAWGADKTEGIMEILKEISKKISERYKAERCSRFSLPFRKVFFKLFPEGNELLFLRLSHKTQN